MVSEYTAYIDEAGDLGVAKGTKWFVLTAVLVKKDQESEIRAKMRLIRDKLNISEIHFRKISDFKKKAFVIRSLEEHEFTYMNILVDTQLFDKTKIPNAIIAYNYICMFLLQRISSFLEENHVIGDVVLSARGTSRDGELIQYIQEKLLPYPNNRISQAVFNNISAKTSVSWDMLQLADVCATSMFLTYEPNEYGFTIPCFSSVLKNHLYHKNGKIKNNGLTFFTPQMEPNSTDIKKSRICLYK